MSQESPHLATPRPPPLFRPDFTTVSALDEHFSKRLHSGNAYLSVRVLHFNFLFVPCGRLSWLPVSFLLHVKYTLSYRIL